MQSELAAGFPETEQREGDETARAKGMAGESEGEGNGEGEREGKGEFEKVNGAKIGEGEANGPKSRADNLLPYRFPKGVVSHPHGRAAPAFNFPRFLRAWLLAYDPKSKEQKERLIAVVERLAKSDPKTLLHYAFGKPLEQIALTGADGAPLNPLAGLRIEVIGAELPREKPAIDIAEVPAKLAQPEAPTAAIPEKVL